MVHETTPSTVAHAWDDPERCPFCLTALVNGGAGFIEHIETRETCEKGFDRWRANVSGDVSGEWVG